MHFLLLIVRKCHILILIIYRSDFEKYKKRYNCILNKYFKAVYANLLLKVRVALLS